MAVLKPLVSKAKAVGKGGVLGGSMTGIVTGIPLMMGLHPFISYILGGVVSSALLKDSVEKKICLFESFRESFIQLFSAD